MLSMFSSIIDSRVVSLVFPWLADKLLLDSFVYLGFQGMGIILLLLGRNLP